MYTGIHRLQQPNTAAHEVPPPRHLPLPRRDRATLAAPGTLL